MQEFSWIWFYIIPCDSNKEKKAWNVYHCIYCIVECLLSGEIFSYDWASIKNKLCMCDDWMNFLKTSFWLHAFQTCSPPPCLFFQVHVQWYTVISKCSSGLLSFCQNAEWTKTVGKKVLKKPFLLHKTSKTLTSYKKKIGSRKNIFCRLKLKASPAWLLP
jgi:hypothetical protein